MLNGGMTLENLVPSPHIGLGEARGSQELGPAML